MQGQPKGQSPSSCNEIFGHRDEIALNLIVLGLCMDELDYHMVDYIWHSCLPLMMDMS